MKQLDGDTLYTSRLDRRPARRGGGGGGGGRGGGGGGAAVQFSDDGRWIGYFVNPPARRPDAAAAARAVGRAAGAPGRRRQRGGARRRGGAPASAARESPTPSRALRAARSDERRESSTCPTPAASSSPRAREWLAIKMNGAAERHVASRAPICCCGDSRPARRRTSATSTSTTSTTRASWLAYTVDAADRLGNGVYVDESRDRRDARARQRGEGVRRPRVGRRLDARSPSLRGEKPRGQDAARERAARVDRRGAAQRAASNGIRRRTRRSRRASC